MRPLLSALFRRLLNIFFRRIEIVGIHNVPDSAPVVFAVNHPNGLVDPLFILGFVPRRVSFLAKAPLFTMPVIGYFVRAFDSVPVYRKQDKVAGTHAETFARAREILSHGGAIAIFPEGTTHSDTRLREFKTGAARIALGSSLPGTTIVPAGIYYTEKQTFRSKALIAFGEPIAVPAPSPPHSGGEGGRRPDEGDLRDAAEPSPGASRHPLPQAGEGTAAPLDEPEPDAVHALTDRIEAALHTLTLQADSHAALELIAQAEDIFTGDPDQPLVEELELRRRFIAGYHELRDRDPQRLAILESAIRQFSAELGRAGLEPHELTPRVDAGTIARVVFLFPIAAAGAVLHYVPYRIVDFLSRRFARGSELTATVKFVAALAFYPLTWLIVAVLVWRWIGLAAAVLALILLPLLGYLALRVTEDLDDAVGRTRALIHRLFWRDAHAELVEQRRTIRREIAALEAELNVT